ncbi:MAG: hypothetical protein PHS68_06880 [Candidatus Izemoplasmatales bacterium]|nr:hypothetical protein [Candidatus Izemoplasmatales bacterium]
MNTPKQSGYVGIIMLVILAFIVMIPLGLALKAVMFPVRTAENMINTAYDANDKVINADNAIYNYEWFKQKYQDIEVAKKQYKNSSLQFSEYQNSLPDSRLDWTFEDKQEESRLRAVMTGQYNYVESLVGDYNARASMATRNIFENSVLPNYIDALTFITK